MSKRALLWCGWLGIAAAVTGIASGIVMPAWPVHSPRELLRYPFTQGEFQAIQTWFAVHHLAMAAVFVGLARSNAFGARRIARGAAWVAAFGVVLLAANEIHAIGYAEWTLSKANQGVLGAGYGISTNLVGLGAVVAGIGVLRERRWTGWHRWVPLAIGIVHFVGVTPALFSESFVGARVAIVTWIALFGALGHALIVETRDQT